MPDLRTSWDAVTQDENGDPLPNGQPDFYNLYRPGEGTPFISVPGDQTSYVEAGAITDTGVYTREMTAQVGVFESANRAQGSATFVRPGEVVNIIIQGA